MSTKKSKIANIDSPKFRSSLRAPPDKDLIIADKKFTNVLKSKTKINLHEFIDKTPIEEYEKWFISDYVKNIPVLKNSSQMNNISKTKLDLKYGSMLRMNNISSMKYQFLYNTMDMIVIVMRLYDYEIRKETNYATLFCELIDTMIPSKQKFLSEDIKKGNVAFTFYSASSSYISSDGEYRNKFSYFRTANRITYKYPDIWNELEEYVIRIKQRRQWNLSASYFYPKMEQESKNIEVESSVRSKNIPMMMLIITWFHNVYNEIAGITESHMNPVFKEIFHRYIRDDVKFIQELIKKVGGDRVDQFRAEISHTITKGVNALPRFISCGYKMIPLNIREVQDPLRLRYKPWRECLINNRCNDLVINNISPNFPVALDWFYIKNSRRGLYDNKSQDDRMKYSELAKDIIHILYEAQRNTYFASENLTTIVKTDNQIKQWVNSKFKKLSEKIDDPINFSKEEIILSEVTLSFVSENVGRTVADILNVLPTSKILDNLLGKPLTESGYVNFAKYMFEVCYALYCLNSKFNLIHGDLHLNNVTIGPLYNPSLINYRQTKDIDTSHMKVDISKKLDPAISPKVLYVLGDQNQYVFNNNGYFSCIIDFSRSIINPYNYEIFKDESLPITFSLVKDEAKFQTNEINMLINLYTQLFPNKIKQKEELQVLFKNHYEAAFRLLTCIDVYMFTIRLSRMLQQTKYPVVKKCIELTDKMNRLAETYITTEMNSLLADNSYANKILSEDYPILTIINKCFFEFLDGNFWIKKNKTLGTITDIYDVNSPIEYSLSKYDKFPDWLKYVKYEDKKAGKLVNDSSVEEVRKDTRISYEDNKTKNLEMVNYIAMRHVQKLV